MSKADILIQWTQWRRRQSLVEEELELVKAVEDLVSQVGTFKAERDRARAELILLKQERNKMRTSEYILIAIAVLLLLGIIIFFTMPTLRMILFGLFCLSIIALIALAVISKE